MSKCSLCSAMRTFLERQRLQNSHPVVRRRTHEKAIRAVVKMRTMSLTILYSRVVRLMLYFQHVH